MHELERIVPDPQVLLALEPEVVGAKILFMLRKRCENVLRPQQSFLLSNLLGELWPGTYPYVAAQQQQGYPPQKREEINLAICGGVGLVSRSRLARARTRRLYGRTGLASAQPSSTTLRGRG